jgi:cobalamin synthase
VTERFLTALAFLTRIPVRHATCTPEAIGRSASLFPLVGALVGAAQVLALWTCRRALPPTLTATAIVLTWVFNAVIGLAV